ncbi:MAG: hypothetical protein CMF94_02385 [Candidatus Marinimicrobia bacterium]|nr:hypothetical protein [Candidatus Neomarinimicrobiota bacterium]
MIKYFKLSLAVIISVSGLYFAFSGEDFETFIYNLSVISIKDLCFASILLIFSCIPRALRWKLIIEPFESIPLNHVFSATMIGYFGNGILVFRLGEVLKAFALSKGYKITVSQAFGTVVAERILDLLMVLFIFIATFTSFPMNDDKIKVGVILSNLLVVLLTTTIVITYKFNLLSKISKFEIFTKNYGQKIFSIIEKFFEGVVVIFKNRNIYFIIFLSFLIWGIYFYISVILLQTCGISLSLSNIGVLLVISSFILGIPSLPGAAGTLDVGVKYTLVLIFNIASSKALTYSIISHAISYFPLLLIGFVYFLTSNVSLKDVRSSKNNI